MKHLFITGAGRSGTTFLWRILNNSPSVHLATEIHYFSSLFHCGFLKNLKKQSRRNKVLTIDDIIHFIQTGNHFGMYWYNNRFFPDQEIRQYFGNRKLNEKNIYEYLIEHDLKARAASKINIKYIGEKTPLNIFHVRRLFKWFSDASILFIHRNPVHVLRSEVNKKRKPDYPMSKENPLYAYGLVIFVFFEWLLAGVIALYNKAVHKEKFIIVSYEDLTSHCESMVHRISSAIDIGYAEDLCAVKKFGSSYSNGNQKAYWYPPSWVVLLYSLFLHPLRILLNRVSLIHEETYLKS